MGKWNRGKSKGVRGLRAGIAVMAAVCLLAESAGCGAAEEGTAEAAAAQYQNHLDISLAYWQIDSFLNKRGEDKVLEVLEIELDSSSISPLCPRISHGMIITTRSACGRRQESFRTSSWEPTDRERIFISG